MKTAPFKICRLLGMFMTLAGPSFTGLASQRVEGFEQVEFHYEANRNPAGRDFRGTTRGYMTAGWWAPGQAQKNFVSWQTAIVPEKAPTVFSFIGSTCVLPSEFSTGPAARLYVNDQPVLTFSLGMNRSFTWQEGTYMLKYVSKRVEFPYFGSHRQGELNGNSGIFELAVPADAVEAGEPVVLKVEVLPFEAWNGGWFMIKEYRDTLATGPVDREGEIEVLRQDMARLVEQTHVLASLLYQDQLSERKFEHRVIDTNGHKHLHPADLIRLQNGDLLMMTREASEHYAQDGDVIMLRSKDGGLTWEGRQAIAALEKVDEREGCGIQLSDGTIVVGIYYNGLYREDGSYIFGSDKHLSDPQQRYLGAYTITSRDDGNTWSAPNYIDTTGMPFNNIEGPTDAPIEMPDGSVIMAVIGYNIAGDPKNRSSVLLRSTDGCKTWRYVSTIASDPGGKLGGFVEPGIVRTKSGRLVVAMRNHGQGHAIWTTYSDDQGRTWQPVRRSSMIGHPVDLIQLTDGRLMASYGVRPPVHGRPGGVRATFSDDNGESWDVRTEVQIRSDFPNWDIGYPESIQLADGRILTVYYYNLFGRYFIGGTYWAL